MERPNILLLTTDQQRWDALGINGNPDVQTPHLDALARSGVSFDRFFVQNAVCMPSRVSMLSGRYPATLGILRNGVPVPAGTLTLPRLLRNYGYTSAIVGKLHFLPHAHRDHRQIHPAYGFDHLEVSDEPGCYEDAYRAWVRRTAPEQLDHISVGLPPAAHVWQQTLGVEDGIRHRVEGERFDTAGAIAFAGDEAVTHSAFVAERTMAYLRRQARQPFLCVAGFYSPHSPWVVPQRFLDLYQPQTLALPDYPPAMEARRAEAGFDDGRLRSARHGYYAMVSEVDHHVGRILACLDELGLNESTVVVFTSDHGEWLGEHLRYGKGYPGHDAVTRVPLIIRWSAGIGEPGRVEHAIAEAVDLVPTLLAAAGIPLHPGLQGCSFLPWLQGQRGRGRSSALCEMEGWKTLRTDRYRYVVDAGGREWLYDLRRDPAGYVEVAEDPACREALNEARHELLTRLIQRERPLPRAWAY